jgi:cell division septal protein FtsQ
VPVAAPADRRFRRAQVKPARRKRSWTGRVLVVGRFVLAVAFFGGGGYVLTQQVAQATSLHVDRIIVRGNDRLQTGEVLALLEGLRGEHVLRVDLDRWRRRVETSPWVEQAGLRRVLPSTIEVFIREREPLAIGRRGDELFLVDATGRVIDDYGPNYAQFDLPIVDGLVPKAVRHGEPEVDEDRASLAVRIVGSLRRNDAVYRSVSQIDVSNPRDATVILEDDRALVHLGDEQFAERLEQYMELKPALLEQVPEIESVDLRFDNRLYVRPAGSRKKDPGR